MRSQEDRLIDIVSAVNDAAVLVERGHSRFTDDPLLIRAAKNSISEIGEAAKGLDDELLATMPGVPWKNVKGLRDCDKVVHDYPEVDLDVGGRGHRYLGRVSRFPYVGSASNAKDSVRSASAASNVVQSTAAV